MSTTPERPRLVPGTAAGLVLLAAAAALLAAGCGGGAPSAAPLPAAVGQLLRATLESKTLPAEVREQEERKHVWDDMGSFYRKRLWMPAWSDEGGPSQAAEKLLEVIPEVAREGVNPERYRRDELARRVEEVEQLDSFEDPAAQRRLVETDLQLTYAFMTLAHHLAAGRQSPRTINVESYTKPRDVDLAELLAGVLANPEDLADRLLGLVPPHEEYARLRAAVAAYRAQAAEAEWPPVPAGPPLRRGAPDARVALLRARLAASGDVQEESGGEGAAGEGAPQTAAVFDPAVERAVRRFQGRHGLEVTGIVDEATLAALNVPIGRRVRQMELNMERWRWLPADLGARHIEVNVPDYSLKVIENGRSVLAMRVVVGKDQSRTPAFSDTMTFVELNPYWHIPPSILREEILPELASDPGYLERHDMEVVSEGGEELRVRQRPGPENPLGQIKFMFPNDFNIYLHDTPAGHLFTRTERTFSHGCIRIEQPMALADYLFRGDPKWSHAALAAAIASGENRRIDLPRPLPVHILYWTAWVDKDGTLQFRDDVYGHDATLEAALRDEPPLDLDLPIVGGEQRAAR